MWALSLLVMDFYAGPTRPYVLLKGSMFNKFLKICHCPQILSSFMFIISCPTFIQGPTFILFCQIFQPYNFFPVCWILYPRTWNSTTCIAMVCSVLLPNLSILWFIEPWGSSGYLMGSTTKYFLYLSARKSKQPTNKT